MNASTSIKALQAKRHAWAGSILILVIILAVWSLFTWRPSFNSKSFSDDQLMMMEFTGDIVKNRDGDFIFNPAKQRGFPSPKQVAVKSWTELSRAFVINGPNDHGIGWLVLYTTIRFLIGFVVAVVLGVILGITIGMQPVLYYVLNPYIQILKPISPLAWMPLLLATVKASDFVTVLVVFMAALWPTVASTSFGVSSMPKEYLQVARLLGMNRMDTFRQVILPAIAPSIIAGFRISFGSALVAVVPAEMLTGELGVGNYTWVVWNNGDLAGVIFGIIVIGALGFILDTCVTRLSRCFNYQE